MAAVAATGLTCCGGCGGGDSLEGATIKFFEVGTSAGSMYVTVLNKSGANSSYTLTRFGGEHKTRQTGEIVEQSSSMDPDLEIPDNTTKVRHVSVSLDSYDDSTNNREATGFYASITGAATDNGNNNGNGNNNIDFDFPQTWITMMYEDHTSGKARFTFKFKVDQETITKIQEMEQEEREKYMEEFDIDTDYYTTVSVNGYFHYEN